VLIPHIVYFKIDERAEQQSLLDSLTWVFGVNVYFYDIVVINRNNAVSYGFQKCPETGCVGTFG